MQGSPKCKAEMKRRDHEIRKTLKNILALSQRKNQGQA
jgi:hypothetical protein